jgi:hypothetical protein
MVVRGRRLLGMRLLTVRIGLEPRAGLSETDRRRDEFLTMFEPTTARRICPGT